MASEGFPTPYKANSRCTWYITVSIAGTGVKPRLFWGVFLITGFCC